MRCVVFDLHCFFFVFFRGGGLGECEYLDGKVVHRMDRKQWRADADKLGFLFLPWVKFICIAQFNRRQFRVLYVNNKTSQAKQ